MSDYGAAVARLIRAARAVERAEHLGRHGDGRDTAAAAELRAARRHLAAVVGGMRS